MIMPFKRSLALLLMFLASCAEGEYQVPYVSGTEVTVLRDFVTHDSPRGRMYDLATDGPAFVAAAADGWVRFIEDQNTTEGSGDNNYVWIEHPYPFCQDPSDSARADWPGKPANYDQTCKPCRRGYCNEWTIYAHMAPNSVTGQGGFFAGLSEDDWVTAGQPIGIEDDIGVSSLGDHLHWHVFRGQPDWEPEDSQGGGHYEGLYSGPRPELHTRVCTTQGKQYMVRHRTYTSAACPS